MRSVTPLRSYSPKMRVTDAVARVVIDEHDLATAAGRDGGEVRGDLAARTVGPGADDDDRASRPAGLTECGFREHEPIRRRGGGVRGLIDEAAFAGQ